MLAIKSCLWFQSEAEEAATFYVSIFPNSKIGHVMRAGGAVIVVDFVLDGNRFMALNGRQQSAFTDAVSFVVPCETQADVDRYWDALVRGGEEGRCGWLKDRFGVSWQIVPNALGALLGDPDPAKAGRAMQAMLGMKKLDVAALERARDGVETQTRV
ncbi:MAG: 3-demethylubiquinone-9 3-methyltransferase [Gemmatimonadetes bacterium]|nr:3-demethylubiquinone-9 3-methyltransferase [Gemmatimonadota bacterium]